MPTRFKRISIRFKSISMKINFKNKKNDSHHYRRRKTSGETAPENAFAVS